MKLKDVLKYLIPSHQEVDLYDHPFENEPIKNTSSRLEQILKPEILERNVSKIQAPRGSVEILLEAETNEQTDGKKFDFFEKLKGAKLVYVDVQKHGIVVRKDNRSYVITFDEDDGGCCGFNEIVTELCVDLESDSPVITNITADTSGIEELDVDYIDCEYVRIVFFGESKKLMSVKSLSSSGSGYCYGACVTVRCKALDIEEVITSW